MRHKKFLLGRIHLNGVPVELRYGDLLVAQGEGANALDWEVVLRTEELLRLEQAPYDVHMETKDERQLWGQGVLVRTDGLAHVLRGGGRGLDGFAAEDFD
ncbi:MAG: hypothetical protein ACKVWR_19795 [Acidimicrobiales bacterium]